ncbi:MAG: hypothetical protein ACR2PL_21895, partial [Dehalococcoidia bacterium]
MYRRLSALLLAILAFTGLAASASHSAATAIESNSPAVAAFSVTLTASATSVEVGTSVTLTATSDRPMDNSGYLIEIRRDGSDYSPLQQCGNGSICTVPIFYTTPQSHLFDAVIVAADTGAHAAFSNTITVKWSSPFTLTLTPSATSVPVGTEVTLTARSTQDVGQYEIQIVQDNYTILTHCHGTICAIPVTSTAPNIHGYRARIALPNGSEVQASSSNVLITWTTTLHVTLTPNATSVPVGTSVALTATSDQDLTATPYKVRI